MAERFPGFDAEATLLKVVTINALYGTRVFALMRMAQHVQRVFAACDLAIAGPELVDKIAALPPPTGQKARRQHLSFASKFAHFFVDPERFPIRDRYVVKMLRYHLGRGDRSADANYVGFVADFNALRTASGHDGPARELDYYLWIAGMYRRWRRTPGAKMNREATALFRDPPAEVAADLRVLMGEP